MSAEIQQTMRCPKCGGLIEYPSTIAMQIFPCPICGQEVLLSDSCQILQAENSESKKPPLARKKTFELPENFWGMALAVIVTIGVLVEFIYLGSSIISDNSKPSHNQAATQDPYAGAYEAAKTVALQTYPTVKSFSSFNDTGITLMDDKGGYYQVELVANFADEADKPDKKAIECSMLPDGDGQWKLLKIYIDSGL